MRPYLPRFSHLQGDMFIVSKWYKCGCSGFLLKLLMSPILLSQVVWNSGSCFETSSAPNRQFGIGQWHCGFHLKSTTWSHHIVPGELQLYIIPRNVKVANLTSIRTYQVLSLREEVLWWKHAIKRFSGLFHSFLYDGCSRTPLRSLTKFLSYLLASPFNKWHILWAKLSAYKGLIYKVMLTKSINWTSWCSGNAWRGSRGRFADSCTGCQLSKFGNSKDSRV